MMINFILGRSGSGKSEYIYSRIAELEPEEKAVLIVPEQSSFYNEKLLLSRLGEKKAKNTEVLSFRRLCSNILEEYKGRTGQRINDGVKAVLMSMAIEKAPSEGGSLELYGKTGKGSMKKTMELIEPMLIAVNEYKMCMISPERLFQAAGTVESKVLASKLRDSARIYAAYNAILENSYEDPDDDLIRLYDLLGENSYFAGMTVFIDSFTGFSAQEIKICERIFSQCRNVYISLCCDREILSHDTCIFAESNMTYRTLLRSAKSSGHECRITDLAEQSGRRYKSPALMNVEKWLFSSFRTGQQPEVSENDGAVEIYRAGSVYDEISFAAKRIFELVHEQGYKYNEIELITRNIDEYKSVIRSEFPKYGIPCFMAERESLEGKQLIKMVTTLFDVIHGGFDAESVLRLAKCGFTGLSDYETFELEDYVYIWSIRGDRFRHAFTMSPEGNRSERDNEEELTKAIERIESIRQKLMKPLIAFETEVHSAYDGAQITKAVYNYIETAGCRIHFRAFISDVREKEGEAKAEREADVWDKLMGIMDKLYSLLGGIRMDSRAYLDLLRIYIRKTPIGDIPQTVNSITVGIAGSIRSEAPRAVIAIGCNEGEFPPQPSAVGIFTDSERRFLREESPEDQRLPLYESIFGNSLKEKYNVYAALSAPSEKLIVSFHTQNISGSSCEPSVIISELKTLLPGIEFISSEYGKEKLYTERQSFDLCSADWNENTSLSASLKEYFLSNDKYKDRADAIMRFSDKTPFVMKEQDKIRRLFGSPLRLSSTKLDQFAACKFAYFCKFGIEVLPLRKASMDGGLYGTAMHYIFERILSENEIEDFINFSDDKLKTEIRKYLDEYLASIGDTQERSSRFSAICTRIRRNAFKTLRRMRLQFIKDSFRPVDYELRIGANDSSGIPAYELELPTGDRILVSGFVDRVDTVTVGNNKYIRIIDYKTGSDVFRLGNIANGIKLQMLLYLSAILKNGAEKYSDGLVLLPAGVLYVPSTAKAPTALSGRESDIEASGEDENKSFRMRGLLLGEKDILELMESGLAGEFIPASAKKKPPFDLSSKSSVVSQEDFSMIFRYIDNRLKSMGTELYAGNIEAYPEKHACDYCDYKSVCRFEKGDKSRELPNLDSKNAMKIIASDEKGGADEDDS